MLIAAVRREHLPPADRNQRAALLYSRFGYRRRGLRAALLDGNPAFNEASFPNLRANNPAATRSSNSWRATSTLPPVLIFFRPRHSRRKSTAYRGSSLLLCRIALRTRERGHGFSL